MSSVLPTALQQVVQQAKRSTIEPATIKNGVGHFVFPCRKMVFNYCEASGSSRGMVEYLQREIIGFAKQNPHIEVIVQPRPSRHPIIRAFYLNGKQRVLCMRKKSPEDITEAAKHLSNLSGNPNRLWKKPVLSDTPSVRGIWSPFHAEPHKISDLKGH